MEAHQNASDSLIAEAISKVEYTPPFWMGTVNMGKVIGKDACVPVTEADDVRWICRPGRDIKSPIVFNRTPEDTQMFTIGICKDDDGLNTVFTAFPGQKAPKEPNDPNLRDEERAESELFWGNHALCHW